MALYARLDKTGLRVLCGWAKATCQGEIALVVGYDDRRYICFVSGWRPDAGRVWRPSNRIRRRLRRAQLGYPTAPAVGHALAQSPQLDGSERWGLLPYGLPLQAVCPRCDQRQTLDPERLDAEPNPEPPGHQGPPARVCLACGGGYTRGAINYCPSCAQAKGLPEAPYGPPPGIPFRLAPTAACQLTEECYRRG